MDERLKSDFFLASTAAILGLRLVFTLFPFSAVKGKKTVNLEVLSCEHHSLMLSGMSLLSQNPFGDLSRVPLKVAKLA